MVKKWKNYPSEKQQNEFADAFYDENYTAMSQMLGKKVSSLEQAENELFKFKQNKSKKKKMRRL